MKSKTKETKTWECVVLHSNVETTFRKFFDLYEKDRLAARIFIKNKKLTAQNVVDFKNKNIHIITTEFISYGVSVTLKMYKSKKIFSKYYVDTNNGLISKYFRGKFIPCKINDLNNDIKLYLIKLMPWIQFVFESNLPITFTTVVSKKLYSHKKLLSWYWVTNYPTAKQLSEIFNGEKGYYLRKNIKYVRNLNNLNSNFIKEKDGKTLRTLSNIFDKDDHISIFWDVFLIAIVLGKKVNAAWSFKRLLSEKQNMNKEMNNILYIKNKENLKINEKFLMVVPLLKDLGFIVPTTTEDVVSMYGQSCENMLLEINDIENGYYLPFKYNNNIINIRCSDNYNYSYYKKMHGFGGQTTQRNINQVDADFIEQTIYRINLYVKNKLKNDIRKGKIEKIMSDSSDDVYDFFNF